MFALLTAHAAGPADGCAPQLGVQVSLPWPGGGAQPGVEGGDQLQHVPAQCQYHYYLVRIMIKLSLAF